MFSSRHLPLWLAAAASVVVLLVGWRMSIPRIDFEPQEGDVVFQSLPRNPLINAIEGATDSPFSHCGVLHRAESGWVVIEAIGPVKETPLVAWVAQSRDWRTTVFRLKAPYRDHIPAFIREAQAFEGRPYDIRYEFDDAKIYCSELIYKAFRAASGEELGQLQALGELNWQPHTKVIESIEGGEVPVERKMITPRGLSEAMQLEQVYPEPA